jgi:hypothetical protein
MAPINYNFAEAVSGLPEIPAPRSSFSKGPSVFDKPFLDYVTRTLREDGNGGMPFATTKERDGAARRIGRFLVDQHEIPIKTYGRSIDGRAWLYWELVEDDSSDEEESLGDAGPDSLVAEEEPSAPADSSSEPKRDESEDAQWPY